MGEGIVQAVGIVCVPVGEYAVVGRDEVGKVPVEEFFIAAAYPFSLRESLLRQKSFPGIQNSHIQALQGGEVVQGFAHVAAAEQYQMGSGGDLLDYARVRDRITGYRFPNNRLFEQDKIQDKITDKKQLMEITH